MILTILCLFCASHFASAESDGEKKIHDLTWLNVARRFPEIQFATKILGVDNLGIAYPVSDDGDSRYYNDTSSDSDKIPNNWIVLWEDELSDVNEFTNGSVKNSSTPWDKCKNDLLYTMRSLYNRQPWAIQMVDATGKPHSGILRGSTRWLGNFKECQDVVVPPKTEGDLDLGGFVGQQCLVQWAINASEKMTMQFTTGVCVPSSCNSVYLKNNSDAVRQFISHIPLLNVTNDILKLTNIDCSDHVRSWTGGDIAYMCLFAVFCTLIIAGTLCDIGKKLHVSVQNESKERQNESNQQKVASINSNSSEVIAQGIAISISKEELCKDVLPLTAHAGKKDNSSESKADSIVAFLICFSLYTNAAKLINVENQKGQLSCLHGIRFLSMSWIILGHTFIFLVTKIANPMDAVQPLFHSFSFQAIYQGVFSVDTFFFLSGFLLTYLFLKEYSKSDKEVNWIYYYLHRIWRLSPAFFMILGFYATIWLHMDSGPLWPTTADNGNCDEGWWWNILYIVNFRKNVDMCMGWTWYLANDMQFYVISPLFLVFLLKSPIVGNLLVGIVMLASWITTGIISLKFNFSLQIDNTKDEDDQQIMGDINQDGNLFDDIYDKPYCRIGPYLVGILVGYALHKTDGRQKFMKMWMSLLGWLLALFVLGIVVFGTYHSKMGKATAAAYNSLSRTAWSIGLGWIVFACLTGHGGSINTLLSWKLWIPLSRLTYCAYLIHPLVMFWYGGSLLSLIHYEMTTMVMYYFGFLIMSYLVAFITSLAFESPMMALEKFILKQFSSPKTVTKF